MVKAGIHFVCVRRQSALAHQPVNGERMLIPFSAIHSCFVFNKCIRSSICHTLFSTRIARFGCGAFADSHTHAQICHSRESLANWNPDNWSRVNTIIQTIKNESKMHFINSKRKWKKVNERTTHELTRVEIRNWNRINFLKKKIPSTTTIWHQNWNKCILNSNGAAAAAAAAVAVDLIRFSKANRKRAQIIYHRIEYDA